MRIRPIKTRDAAALLPLFPLAFPDRVITLREVREQLSAAAYSLLAEIDSQTVGFVVAMPVPGLPDQLDLSGAVAVDRRRQGIGTALLQGLVAHLRPQGYHTLTYALTDSHAPVAYFLPQRGFILHHEEWELHRPGDLAIPPIYLPYGYSRRQLTRLAAAATFRRLYDESFGPHPWYQPYGDEELLHLFRQQGLPQFLCQGELPVGFIWSWVDRTGLGIIEPVGIIPTHQGQGLGRQLILSALLGFPPGAIPQVKIGAWHSNAAAIHLYQSLGFRRVHTITHLQLRIGE
ncbi:MAG: GNAT family N-acetyltransferase [Chloroflexi bacterium]|nr:GNAT family N-acetyltransferase [Chloroflexota bacterium]MBP8055642.1 GNAT family N-acetyltransferase [Chloroflexota bacterium]